MPYFDDFCRSRCLLTFFNKSVEFSEKYQRGGVIFNLKKYVADFGNFKQGFSSMKVDPVGPTVRYEMMKLCTGSVEGFYAFMYCTKWRSGQVLPMPD